MLVYTANACLCFWSLFFYPLLCSGLCIFRSHLWCRMDTFYCIVTNLNGSLSTPELSEIDGFQVFQFARYWRLRCCWQRCGCFLAVRLPCDARMIIDNYCYFPNVRGDLYAIGWRCRKPQPKTYDSDSHTKIVLKFTSVSERSQSAISAVYFSVKIFDLCQRFLAQNSYFDTLARGRKILFICEEIQIEEQKNEKKTENF